MTKQQITSTIPGDVVSYQGARFVLIGRYRAVDARPGEVIIRPAHKDDPYGRIVVPMSALVASR